MNRNCNAEHERRNRPTPRDGNQLGRHIKNGLARWVAAAPKNTPVSEIIEARKRYESPAEAWPEGPNATLDEYGGDRA